MKKANSSTEKYVAADITAIQHLEQGNASPDMQKRALALIINNLAMTYHPSFMDTDRETTFKEGRRYVGLELVNMLKLNASKLTKK